MANAINLSFHVLFTSSSVVKRRRTSDNYNYTNGCLNVLNVQDHKKSLFYENQNNVNYTHISVELSKKKIVHLQFTKSIPNINRVE